MNTSSGFYFTSVSRSTLMKYIQNLTRSVKGKTHKYCPIVLQLCSTSGSQQTHITFLSMLPFLPKPDTDMVVLLSFGSVDDEYLLDAESIEVYILFTLSIFKKDWSNVTTIIGDNCSTDKAVVRNVWIVFIGRASHRYILAARNYFRFWRLSSCRSYCHEKLKTLKAYAKLRWITHLCPILKNDTRLSSTYRMTSR